MPENVCLRRTTLGFHSPSSGSFPALLMVLVAFLGRRHGGKVRNAESCFFRRRTTSAWASRCYLLVPSSLHIFVPPPPPGSWLYRLYRPCRHPGIHIMQPAVQDTKLPLTSSERRPQWTSVHQWCVGFARTYIWSHVHQVPDPADAASSGHAGPDHPLVNVCPIMPNLYDP